MNRNEMKQEALGRAVNNQALTNYPAIFEGFLQKGIPEDQIRPRENVFTFWAWQALGRKVKKGEHGVRVYTFVPMTKKTVNPETGENEVIELGKQARHTTVFHVTQTEPLN